MIVPPCKDCKHRKLGCHSRCKAYKDFKRLKEKEKENRRKEFQKDGKNFI